MPDYETLLPNHMKQLPRDEAGRPVPKFVAWVDGKPDFRFMEAKHLTHCVRDRCCWNCGEPLGRYAAFVVGPMCLVNRISAEPPSHVDCAKYSATHCPFLTNPNKVRREANVPDGVKESAGVMITRNPGVTAVIVCTDWVWFREGAGLLFKIGASRKYPNLFIERVEWYAHGRKATRAEIDESIRTGLPALRDMCDVELDVAGAHAELDFMVQEAERWLPV